MNEQDSQVQTLVTLGLNCRQAKVYLHLVNSGMSAVKAISQGTRIAQQHIYKIVSTLSEQGLVQKCLTVPATFKATPIEIGLSMLMEQKNKEYTKMKADTTNLLSNFKKQDMKATVKQEDPQFIMISGIKPRFSKITSSFENARKTVESMIPWYDFQAGANYAADHYKIVLDRGVHLRYIVDVPPEKNQFEKIIEPLMQHPCFEIRYIPPLVPALFVMFDEQEVGISKSSTNAIETPDLWVTNPSVISMIHEYFEMMWTTAIKPSQINQ